MTTQTQLALTLCVAVAGTAAKARADCHDVRGSIEETTGTVPPTTDLAYQGTVAPSDGSEGRPKPIQAALNLLRWPAAQVPTIVVVSERPPMVSPLAEGWVVHDADGSPRATIYIAGWSKLYRSARAENRDVSHRIIRLAGVLAHERAHIGGQDEEAAYARQLTTLEALHADPLEITNVHRALELMKRQR